jgi:hypothetical protein
LRDAAAGGFEVVGAVKVGVIEAGDPEFLSIAFDEGVFVEQDTQSGFLKVGNDFDDVVVAENGQRAGAEGGAETPDVGEALMEVAGGVVCEVAGDDGEVMRRAADDVEDGVGQTGQEIEVEIGEVEKAEAVEGGREVGQGLLAGHGLDAQAVGPAPGGPAGKPEEPGDEMVDGNNTLDGEWSLALMDEAGAEVGLAVKALAEEGFAEACGDGAEVDGVEVLSRRFMTVGAIEG